MNLYHWKMFESRFILEVDFWSVCVARLLMALCQKTCIISNKNNCDLIQPDSFRLAHHAKQTQVLLPSDFSFEGRVP